jgi:hypothetical protein
MSNLHHVEVGDSADSRSLFEMEEFAKVLCDTIRKLGKFNVRGPFLENSGPHPT